MKKTLISVVIILSLLISSVCVANATEFTLTSYQAKLHSTSNSTVITGSNNNKLYIGTFPYNSKATEKIYTFDKALYAYVFSDNKVYVLCPSAKQKYINEVSVIEKGNLKSLFEFESQSFGSNCKLSVGKDGFFYIMNRKNQIEVYNKNGKLLHCTDRFHNMITIKGQCYGVQMDKIQKITSSGVSKTYYLDNAVNLYNISDSYIGNSEGSVFHFSGDTLEKAMTIQTDNMKNPCETKDYIVSVKDSNLLAYSKSTGKLTHKYPVGSNVYTISSYNDLVTVVYKDFTIKRLKANEILKVEMNSNSTQTSYNSKSDSTDYGETIIVERGTTAAEFKNLEKFKNLNIVFSQGISGQLGTGDKVKINGKNCTIIVKGDITGEGNINSRDISKMFDHLLDIEKLNDTYSKAGDMNNDGKISNADLVLISKADN